MNNSFNHLKVAITWQWSEGLIGFWRKLMHSRTGGFPLPVSLGPFGFREARGRFAGLSQVQIHQDATIAVTSWSVSASDFFWCLSESRVSAVCSEPRLC